MRRMQDGPNHRLSQGLIGYAIFLIEEDRLDEAKVLVDEAVGNDKAVFGLDHARTASTLDALGVLQLAMQNPEAAQVSTQSALEVFKRRAKDAGYEPELALARLHLAQITLASGNTDSAFRLLTESIPELSTQFGANSAEFADGVVVGGQTALSVNKPANALHEADRAIDLLASLPLPAVVSEVAARNLRSRALLALDRPADAAAESALAIQRLRASIPSASIKLTTLYLIHARAERALGDESAAEASTAQARALGVPSERLGIEERTALVDQRSP